MKKFVVISVILLVLAGGGAAWWYQTDKAVADEQAAENAVQTAKVVRQNLLTAVQATGAVASNQDVDIKCQASGEVVELPYKDVSARVPPGALLMRLDATDEQRSLDLAKAVVAADEAKLREAVLNHDIAKMSLATTQQMDDSNLAVTKAKLDDARNKAHRTQELFEQKLAAAEDLETANTTAASAEADYQAAQIAIAELPQMKATVDTKAEEITQMQQQLAQDQSRMQTADQDVKYCTVTAPVANDPKDPPDWYVSMIGTNLAVGYLVQSGSSGFSGGTTVMTLSDMSHVYVLATVDESDIGSLLEQFTAGHELPVILTADSYHNVHFTGKVVRIATKGVNASNVVTFEVKIEVTSPNRTLLRPVMTTNVEIITGWRDNCLVVPVQAVTRPRIEELDDVVANYTGSAAASAPADGTETATTQTSRKKRQHAGDATLPNVGPQPGSVDVQKSDGTTEKRDVVLGLTDGAVFEVISGLDEGQTVVLKKVGADSRWRGARSGPKIPTHGL